LGDVLVLGRDMDEKGEHVGPEVMALLERAALHQRQTGDTIVVAPGFSPDFPEQSESYANMMARALKVMGCHDVVALESATFNTYGELRVFYDEMGGDGVIGFEWHLKRAQYTARLWIDRDWVDHLDWIGVVTPMSRFNKLIEPLKWLNASLSPKIQLKMVVLYKRFVSKRTSY